MESTPPGITTTQLNKSITFNCDGGDNEPDIIARTWQVNGTEYSLLPAFQSQWTNSFQRLTVNTSALAFPYCSVELTCEVLYSSDLHKELSEPLYFRINGKFTIINKRGNTDFVIQIILLNGFMCLGDVRC